VSFFLKKNKPKKMSNGWLSMNGMADKLQDRLSHLTTGEDEENERLKQQIKDLESNQEFYQSKLETAKQHLHSLAIDNKSYQDIIESQKEQLEQLEALKGHGDYFDMQASGQENNNPPPVNGGFEQERSELLGEIGRLKEEMRANLESKELEIKNVQSRGASETEELRVKLCDLNEQISDCKKETDAALRKQEEEIIQLKSIMEADATVIILKLILQGGC
jgi:predicted  nucleic acid-binding Zn-ribbon protein